MAPGPVCPLPESCDTVVVGGGVTGIVTAIELARAGQDVTVIESRHVGAGATGSSLGVLSTPASGAGYGDPDEFIHGRRRKVWHRERLAAQRYLLRLIEESGADCDLGQGIVLLAPSRSNFDDMSHTVEARNAYYETEDYMVPADALGQEAGGRAAESFVGALVMAGAHHVQPAKMIAGLAGLARALGVSICERTEVVGTQTGPDGFRVRTNGGNLVASDVFLATGGYTREFERYLWRRTLGLPSIAIASEELPADEVDDIFRSGRVLLVNRYRGYSCRPSPDGRRIILAGPVGQTPQGAAEDIEHLHAYFLRLFPDLIGIEYTHRWTGFIAATRDAQGHSGAHAGIWYAVGASGLVSCADSGRRMAQNILHADASAAERDARFPAWPLRDSEPLLWKGVEWSTRLLDLVGKSRLR